MESYPETDKAVPFTIIEDSKIVNTERVSATLVIPESSFPYSGVWISGIKDSDNYFHYRSQISATLDDIFLRSHIENDDMTDTTMEFNLVFCPNACVELSRIDRTRRAQM